MLIDVIQYAHITRNYEIIGSVLWTHIAAAEQLYYIHLLFTILGVDSTAPCE